MNDKTEKDGFYPNDCYIATDDELFFIAPFPDIANTKYSELSDDYGYIKDGYFYLLRGKLPLYKEECMEPGLYEKNGKIVIVEPDSDVDKEKYSVDTAIINTSKEKIIEVLKSKDTLFVSAPEGSKPFKPDMDSSDDILKRALKQAFNKKNVDLDLDEYKHRFTDKNALLNFKQVMKGKSKLSMLLFDRGCDVLNLKYTIIVEELSDDDNIGNRLTEPIIVKSDEDFNL